MRKIKFRSIIRCLALVFASVFLFARSEAQKPAPRVITGKITGSVSKSSITAATISVKGTRNVVSSTETGDFSILAQTGDVLVVSSVGFKPKEIKVSGSTNSVSVELIQDYSNLQDVIVVGYGKMKKSDLSSAVVSVSSAELNKTVNVTLDEALQGKAANVYVSQTSGQPGAGASVIIRGVSTVSGNYQPLYVIDGVQIRPSVPSGGAYNQPAGYANELSGINPDDIDNISVLEGPAATSIYGAAGANGVLMITTKHGKSGQTKISANSLLTVQQRPQELPVMNLRQYADYIHKLEALNLVGSEPLELTDPTILGNGTDWQAALFRNTVLQKHSLALSGGSDKSTFYFSGDYLSQDGIAIGSGFQRGSVRLNLDNQANKWLKFGVNLSAFVTKEKVNITNGNIINIALTQNPTIPVRNADGSFGGPTTDPNQSKYTQTNPIAVALLGNNYNKSFGGIGSMYLDITPIKNLVWHTEANGNYTFTNNYTFNPAYTAGSYVNNNTQGGRVANNNYWVSLNTRLQYDIKLGLHAITAMAGHEASQYQWENLSGYGQQYSTPTIQEISVASVWNQPQSQRGNGAQESYIARVNYSYDNKYILQGVVRRDGNSNFGVNNRFGTFPAVSAAWKISDEGFMKGLKFINDLKLRAEYGVSGNAGNSSNAIYAGLYAASSGWGNGFLPSNFPNPNLKWEQDKSTNIGLDMHILNNRVEIIADAYRKNISNLILNASNAAFLGGNLSGGYGGLLTWPVENVGSMYNQGIGITVNTVNISTKDFQWKTGFNFSIDRNKITKITAPIITQYQSTANNFQAQFLTEEGQPLSMITGYVAEGIFKDYNDISTHAVQTQNGTLTIDPQTGSWVGDIKFKDISGPTGKPDGKVDNNDRIIIGNPWPKFTYNFNTSFNYKGFELNLFFTGVYGNQILNLTRYQNTMPLSSGYNNYLEETANFAMASSFNAADALTTTLLNPGTHIPRPTPSDPNQNVRLTQWALEDGSFLKLKNARLSYRVPAKYLSHLHIFSGLVVTVQSQNVFTVTKYKGYDPEVGMFSYKGVTNIVGMDDGRYPATRSYSFSIGLDF